MDDDWLAEISTDGKPNVLKPPNVAAKVGHEHRWIKYRTRSCLKMKKMKILSFRL